MLVAVDSNNQPLFASNDPVISGLVITLDQDTNLRQKAVAAIASHPAIQVAAAKEHWLPLAVAARDRSEAQAIHHWITSIDGVKAAHVVALSFDPESEAADATSTSTSS
jgi:hypothetical protein